MILQHLTPQAHSAFNNTSFNPERRGDRLIAEHSEELQGDILTIQAAGDKYGADSSGAITRYKEKYEGHLRNWLSSESRCASSAIVGPSNFPAAQMQKRRGWAENKYTEFREWRKRALRVICKSFEPKITINTELQEAVVNLNARLASQEKMKLANTIIRSFEGQERITKLIEIGYSLTDAHKLTTPDFGGRVGFTYHLTNNNQNIIRLKKRVEQLQQKAEKVASGNTVTEGQDGISIVENHEADRVQILFPDKPVPAVIARLNAEAWRWSPKNKAWQRKLTENAKRSAQNIVRDIRDGSV